MNKIEMRARWGKQMVEEDRGGWGASVLPARVGECPSAPTGKGASPRVLEGLAGEAEGQCLHQHGF